MAVRQRKRSVAGKNTRTSSTSKKGVGTRIRSLSRSLGVDKVTLYAAGVLIVAIVTSVTWNAFDRTSADPKVRVLLQHLCSDSEVYCASAIKPVRRTQKSTRDLADGAKLVEIPRHFLLWDLDALRDPFVQQELWHARILDSQPLEADAFLAAYLALLHRRRQTLAQPLQDYLAVLPNNFEEFHPLVLARQLKDKISQKSYTYQLIIYKQRMIQLEYEAFSNASEAFVAECSWNDYVTSRLAVLTRSFGTGQLHENERDTQGTFQSLQDEMVYYKEKTGVDLSKGSFAMVPILDLYQHHANPTVGYAYDPVKRAFVIRSLGLQAGHELWDSYGKHSNPHLYSKFGFVNGDGSEPTQASFAVWHSLFVLPNETQKHELLRYLSFDDGYQDCVGPDNNAAWELKRLKYQHLRAMAHNPLIWTVIAKARRPNATPPKSSEIKHDWPPRDSKLRLDTHAQPDLNGVHGLCRILVVTHEDLGGRAISLLREHQEQAGSYMLPRGDNKSPLEYRTLSCIERLATQSIMSMRKTGSVAEDRLASTMGNLVENTRMEWTLAHLEMEELLTLDLVRGMVQRTLREDWPAEEYRQGMLFTVHSKPLCPAASLDPLLEPL